MEQQTPIEWLSDYLVNAEQIDYWGAVARAKTLEREQMCKILTYYHDSLFNIPLKEGEAEIILSHILTKI